MISHDHTLDFPMPTRKELAGGQSPNDPLKPWEIWALALLVLLIGLVPMLWSERADASPRWTGPITATWYGPGFYHHHTKCGQLYTIHTRGTASMRYPCGTKLTIRNGRRVARVTVVDTGAFATEFDLTARTAMDLCGCWQPYTMTNIRYKRGWL